MKKLIRVVWHAATGRYDFRLETQVMETAEYWPQTEWRRGCETVFSTQIRAEQSLDLSSGSYKLVVGYLSSDSYKLVVGYLSSDSYKLVVG